MKNNDVFRINYTDKYRELHRGDLTHCFEGLGLTKECSTGEFILIDTYWGIGRSDNKWFEVEKIGKEITIEYYCNLDELEQISKLDADYFNDSDVFRLSTQHGCTASCIYWYKRKGAERSKEKMKRILEEKAANAICRIQYATSDHQQFLKRLSELETCIDLNSFYI